METIEKRFECPLCGTVNVFDICTHCLAKLGSQPIKDMSNLAKYQDIAIIDTLGAGRNDLADYRSQLIATM